MQLGRCQILLYFQDLESDGLRDQLVMFAESLNKSRDMIYPPATKASKLGELLPDLADTIEKEHKRLLARKSIIEKRKEEQERLLLDMVCLNNCLPKLFLYFNSLIIFVVYNEYQRNVRRNQEG